MEWINDYLDIEYDTSVPTTEWYGAQPGGCRTVFPFILDKIVELPITLQQDHTLLEILKMSPKQMIEQWVMSVREIEELQGLVLLIVHPDYMNSTERLNAYEEFLQIVKKEHNFWCALPKEVAEWWRARQKTKLISSSTGWVIDGPVANRALVMRVVAKDKTILVGKDSPFPCYSSQPIR